MKLIRCLLLWIFCAFVSSASAQITMATVDPGPYVPGSTITATFTLDPSSCVRPGNVFELYLSDASGSFASEVRIGTYNGFYSAFVNGTIPAGTAPGTGYKLRIKSTVPPAIVSFESNAFEIRAGTASSAALTTASTIGPDAFGFCSGRTTNNTINLTNQSTAGATVTATITNQLTGGAPTTILFDTSIKQFTPQLAHYTAFVKAVMPDGTVSTRTYFIINNNVNTSFTTSNEPIVCLPGGSLQYFIDVSSATGIQRNFPGNIYTINWGDGSSNEYTFCDLQGGTVSHFYTQSSCGSNYQSGNTTIRNVFGVNIQASNSFCGNIGTQVSTIAKVVTVTENRINGPLNGCTNANVTFTNASVLGQDPSSTAPNCQDNNVRFNWYVNGVIALADVPFSTAFTRAFNTRGVYRITLESTSQTNCQGPPAVWDICIQDPPAPSFTVPAIVCTSTTVTPTNTSVVDISCNNNVTYTWSVSPNAGVNPSAPVVTTSAIPPSFTFTNAGIYTISLSITTPNCGTSAVYARNITVNQNRTVDLSPNITLCNYGTFNFSRANGPTQTTYSGDETVLDDTYSWTVTSANGGTHTFVTPSTSKYPTIRFENFDTYTITATVTNVCGTQTDTQVITFTQSPVPSIAFAVNPICFNATADLTGSISGTYTSFQWVNSLGTNAGFSAPNNLSTTYTPTTAERNAGFADVILRVNTGLSGACAIVETTGRIGIFPENTGTNATQSICSGAFATYNPSSTVAGSTFTWTAANADGNATNFSTNGTGNINDDIDNTNPTVAAVVVYTITPTANGCTGTPFTFTVTVNPRPIANAANTTICSGQPAGITLTSNLGNTSYTWTSTASAGITGNTNNAVPNNSNLINDILTNSGTTAGTVTYSITPITNGCSGTPINVVVAIEPAPTTPNAGVNRSICNQNAYTLEGNQPTVGTGKWTQVTTFPGVTFNDDTKFNALVSGLQPGNTYTFRWTITGSGSCAPKTSDVSITVDPLSVGGTTAGSQAVCSGNNTGQITLSGNVGNVLRWESSPDGATWTTIPNETGTSITYTNLTATTHYRAIVGSGSCAPAISSTSIINVGQPVVAANAGTAQILCNATTTTLNGNSPAPNTGQWTLISGQTGVTFNDDTSPNATVSGLVAGQTYTFRWTISGTAPCPPSASDVTVRVDLPSNGGTTAGSTAVCAGNNGGNITLSGQVGNILRWESSTDGFVTTTAIANTTASISYINLTTTTQYRAVVQNGVCGSALSTVATITVNQGAVGAIAGPDQSLCDVSSTTLAGNPPQANSGLWSIVSGPSGAVLTDPTLYNTTITGLTNGTYVLRWTISGLAPCPASSDDMTIVNLPALQNNTITTPSTTNCQNQIITLTGSLPTGGSGTYTYIWESSATGAAPWTVINGQTARDLNITVTSSASYRRTVNSGTCSTISNVINIVALPAIANNTISGDQTICATTTPNAIVGSQPTGGDGTNYTYGWEQSLDGIQWTFVPGASGINYTPPALTQTTFFRRLVSSGACTGAQQNISNQVKITVNPNARAEYTYTNDIGCVPFVLDASNIKAVPYPDRNNTYTWYADGTPIGTGINFPGYTINTYNANVVIRLVVTSSLGCLQAEFTHTFTTRENIVASFTQSTTEGCGPLAVTFTNTTPASPSNVYEWSIDGKVVSTARDLGQQTLAPDPSGKDKIYVITLKVTSSCGVNDVTHQVKVVANPIPALTPQSTSGCSPFTVNFFNSSPGGATNTYVIDFGDGTPPQSYAYGNAISHTYTTTVVRDYEVRMTATNQCSTVTSAPIVIRVSPNTITPLFFAQGNQLTVCAGTTVEFRNNTVGATSYTYDFGDGSTPVVSPNSAPETVFHRYDRAGTFTATMVARNDCSTNSASQNITVLGAPTADFNSDFVTGCAGLTVRFNQTSSDAISYLWDFGDGTTSTDPAPIHTYTNAAPSQYTVSLTVMNSLRCSYTVTKNNYITIVGPPKAGFAISPAATISIPDYTFRFTNESTNEPQTYRWTFGDGDASTLRDPTHTYADTGRYLVTLRTYNEFGCVDSIQKYVQIIGIPGYTFVPNSFIPGSTSVPLQKFMAVGSGMKSWKMTIFNKWGQVLWETTKLEDGKPVEGWDGTYKGVPQPQGIYFWKIEVELINGSEWKGMSLGNGPPRRTGEIYLIR